MCVCNKMCIFLPILLCMCVCLPICICECMHVHVPLCVHVHIYVSTTLKLSSPEIEMFPYAPSRCRAWCSARYVGD